MSALQHLTQQYYISVFVRSLSWHFSRLFFIVLILHFLYIFSSLFSSCLFQFSIVWKSPSLVSTISSFIHFSPLLTFSSFFASYLFFLFFSSPFCTQVRKSLSEGKQLEEAKTINKSLSALGQVLYCAYTIFTTILTVIILLFYCHIATLWFSRSEMPYFFSALRRPFLS